MAKQLNQEEKAQYFRAIFDAMPLPAFIVDEDVRIQDFNTAAEQLLGPYPAEALHCRGGEAFHCIHSEAKGCGRGERCGQCVIRNSVTKAVVGGAVCREMHWAQLQTAAGTVPLNLLVTTSLLPYMDPPRALLILEDVTATVKRAEKPIVPRAGRRRAA
jgi:PAS domain-containing protein